MNVNALMPNARANPPASAIRRPPASGPTLSVIVRARPELCVGLDEVVLEQRHRHPRLEAGVEQHGHRTDEEGDAEHHRRGHPPLVRGDGEQQERGRSHEIDTDQRAAEAPAPIEEHSGGQPEQQHRERLSSGGETEVECIARQGEHEVRQGEERDVVAEQRHSLAPDDGEQVPASLACLAVGGNPYRFYGLHEQRS